MSDLITAHRNMQDLQNYQYYDPAPLETPPVETGKKRVLQLVGLVVLVLVLALAAVVTVNILKNRKLAQERAGVEAQVNQITSLLEADCDEDDQACLDRARADAARELGVVSACENLSGEELRNCVSLIATDTQNPDACKALPADEAEGCADTAYLLKARGALDLKLCESISNPSTQAACTTQIKAATSASNEALRLAIDSGNPADCAALESDLEYECARAQSLADNDNDALVLIDETEYGTDPNNPDTDADGLKDGDEVKVYETNPLNPDTDGDGFTDGIEANSGYDPLN